MIEEIDTSGPAFRKKYTCRMTSQSINRLTDKQAMVTSVNRKPREYLTHTERLDHLHYVSNRNRDRVNFTNKLENFRLRNKNKQLDSHELQQMRALLKFKNDLKFSLVDIAKTKRRLNGSETAFERHLRDGSNEPVFGMEYNRLRRKEHELQLLKDRLEAPNSQILAKRVIDELRNIEVRTMGSEERRMRKFSLLPPITNNIVENVEKIISENCDHGNANTKNEESTEKDISNQELLCDSNIGEIKHLRNEQNDSIKISERLIRNNIQTSKIDRRQNSKRNSKQYSKDNSLPPLLVSNGFSMTNDVGNTSSLRCATLDTEKDSVKRREKETEERLTGLKEKTKFDINRRRSSNLLGIVEPRDSLKSLKCFENFTKLHLKKSGASIVERCNSGYKSNKIRKETRKWQPDTCKLPPLNFNTKLVRELKHQRKKHKKESEGLPKLP